MKSNHWSLKSNGLEKIVFKKQIKNTGRCFISRYNALLQIFKNLKFNRTWQNYSVKLEFVQCNKNLVSINM